MALPASMWQMIPFQETDMKSFAKTFSMALVGAALMTSTFGTTQAEAGCRFACGAAIGAVGGLIAGAALAQPRTVYVAPRYVQPGYTYYESRYGDSCRRIKWYDQYGARHFAWECPAY
jgi:hypothetical protein